MSMLKHTKPFARLRDRHRMGPVVWTVTENVFHSRTLNAPVMTSDPHNAPFLRKNVLFHLVMFVIKQAKVKTGSVGLCVCSLTHCIRTQR